MAQVYPPPQNNATPIKKLNTSSIRIVSLNADVMDVISQKCSNATFKVYYYLERHANKEGLCRPSMMRLAEMCNVTERTVIRSIHELEALNFITVTRTHNSKSLVTANEYSLPHHPRTYGTDMNDTKMSVRSDIPGDIPPVENVTPSKREVTREVVNPSGVKAAKEPGLPFVLWRWWADKINTPANARPTDKDMGIAKNLVAQGIGIPEAESLYGFLANDSYWAEKGFDLGTMLSQIGKWRNRTKMPTARPAGLENF